jgi:hypothetical protein
MNEKRGLRAPFFFQFEVFSFQFAVRSLKFEVLFRKALKPSVGVGTSMDAWDRGCGNGGTRPEGALPAMIATRD